MVDPVYVQQDLTLPDTCELFAGALKTITDGAALSLETDIDIVVFLPISRI